METIKSLKSLQTCLGIFFLLFLGTFYVSAEEYGAASEKKREVSKTFQVSLSDNLSIENRYGNITVTHWNKNEIEIKVVIEAKARNDQRVEELLNYVDIILDKTGNMVTALTTGLDIANTWTENNGNTNGDRVIKTGIQVGGVAASIAAGAGTFALINCWNPAGWVAGIVAIAALVASSYAISYVQEEAYGALGIE